MNLIEAAIKTLGLELFWLEPSDPLLKGARAVFDAQSGTVCCANESDGATRATLVAHEIGHACLHADSIACAETDIDASQSAEVVPVGLQRVEDYSGRERRELQANVFARELLLPRSEAHRLHVTERLTATTIAERLRLSKNLVRQQLFDSLLLPTGVLAPIASDNPLRPDLSQERAASHTGSALLLQAGPGTGKTRTLVNRVLKLLGQGVDPSAILVLTFSNRAAGELVERLTAVAKDAAPRIWTGTFHAFGLDLLRRFHDRLALPSDPVLFDRSDAIEVLEEILPTLPLVHYRNLWDPILVLREIVAAISRAKDELCTASEYRTLAQTMLDLAGNDDDAQLAASKALEVAAVYDLYEKELRRRNAVDFGDLVMRPALLVEHDELVRRALQLRHRHLLVDEYQDVNRASARLVRGISGDGRRLWVVGDSRQSIYRFRGASSRNMTVFPNDYPGATADRLTVN
jgi:Zn-dependent peptidase ImmA (M78 family)